MKEMREDKREKREEGREGIGKGKRKKLRTPNAGARSISRRFILQKP